LANDVATLPHLFDFTRRLANDRHCFATRDDLQ
jgi:hypothetical protein